MTSLAQRVARLEYVLGVNQPIPEVLPIGSLSVRAIAREAAITFGLTYDEITSPARHRRLMYPRAATCWIARRYTTRSLHQIAAAIGRKDHNTVTNAVAFCEIHMARQPDYRDQVMTMRDALIDKGVIEL